MEILKKVMGPKRLIIGFIVCILLGFTVISMHTMSLDKHIDRDDIFSEGLVCAIALSLFLLVQRLSASPRIYVPLSVGFGLYFFSTYVDVFEEFYKLTGFASVAENRAHILGMSLAVFGLSLWLRSKIVAEESLAHSNEQLRMEIERRKQIEEKQGCLLEEVESANNDLKDFAYIVSHDLKAPLRAISSLAEWISTDTKNRLSRDSKGFLELLNKRVLRMQYLIEGILEYSRIGRVKEKRIRVDLNQLISEIVDGIIPSKTIEVEVKDTLPSLVCEKVRIEQIFQNLISNAIKYMDKPQGHIGIECIPDNGFWHFMVTDNGPGIDKKYHNKIFQIFQTLHPGDEFESTGIGLTLVKKIIEMNGGSIWVESQLGKGSTFHFNLPRAKRVKTPMTAAN